MCKIFLRNFGCEFRLGEWFVKMVVMEHVCCFLKGRMVFNGFLGVVMRVEFFSYGMEICHNKLVLWGFH